MKTEKWWHDYEKEWLIERYDRQIEREDMKTLRRIWWNMMDDVGLLAIIFGGISLAATCWVFMDLLLECLR